MVSGKRAKKAAAGAAEREVLERRIARLQQALRAAKEENRNVESVAKKLADAVLHIKTKSRELEATGKRLAQANAEAAELMVELEMKGKTLHETNAQLARANVHAAELMATLEIKDEEISKLNKSLSKANATAAQLVADRELAMEDLAEANRKLKVEIGERRRAEAALQILTDELKQANVALDNLATVDTLTELFNRRGLQRHLDAEFSRAIRTGATMGVIFGDVDDFKQFNEKYGHTTGDAVLQEIARRFKNSLRASDFLSRIGGDEFLAILPGVTTDGLKIVAERVRSEVSKTPLVITPATVKGSVSLAAGLLPGNVCSLKEIMALCREPLKKSKVQGKNRVMYI